MTKPTVARSRSGPSCLEIVDLTGKIHGPFSGLLELQAYAEPRWPNQDDRDDFEIRVVGVAD